MKRELPQELIDRVKHNLRAMTIQEVAFQLKVSSSVVSKIKKGIYGASATIEPSCDAPFIVQSNIEQL